MSKLILPGLIDPHVHLRDPGQTEKEDFYTGTLAALAGGYTTVIDMPNNKIPIANLKLLEEKILIAKEKIVCDVGFYFGSMGDNLEEFPKVINKVLGLKLYLNETTGNYLIDKNKLRQIFKSWTQSMSLRSNKLYEQKPILLHAEGKAIEYVVKLVSKLGTKVHFCHISTQGDLELIVQAKDEGLPVTCGVTPHHLFLTEDDVKTLGPFGKMKPKLAGRKDVDFLWRNLKAIDVIESDHAPHAIEEKTGKFQIPYGVPGLETTLPLLLTAASENRLSIDDIIRLCFENPAKIFNIPLSNDSNHRSYIEVDPLAKYEIDNKKLFTKCSWSPFNGWKVKGKVEKVYIRNQKVFENNNILTPKGWGKIIHQNK
ncbi:MAG: dihydroorotase [Candidatus Levybacteria bacterium]|nr:dihydroorotase [Candidatus Levybacteria bacterium]